MFHSSRIFWKHFILIILHGTRRVKQPADMLLVKIHEMYHALSRSRANTEIHRPSMVTQHKDRNSTETSASIGNMIIIALMQPFWNYDEDYIGVGMKYIIFIPIRSLQVWWSRPITEIGWSVFLSLSLLKLQRVLSILAYTQYWH